MALYEQFPYTNFHELNLADLTAIVKSLQETVELWNGDINAAVAAYISLHPEVMITPDSVYTGALQDGAVTKEKLDPSLGIDYVTPQMFKTDDNTWRDAFQAAFDAGVDVYVPTDAGQVYEIEGPAPVDVDGEMVVRPALVWRNSRPGGKPRKLYGSATWRTVGTAGSIKFKPYNNVQGDEQPLIRVEQDVQGFHIANLRFTTTVTLNTGTCIDAATSTTIDKDIQITDCSFRDYWRVFDFAGRGLNCFNCIFGSDSYVARVRWNSPDTVDDLESRAVWFEGCRFHAITRVVVEVISGHAWGLMINGCLADNSIKGLVWQTGTDSAENWMITNNLFQDMQRSSGFVDCIVFNASANNCIISDNYFHARDNSTGSSHIVLFNDAATGCKIDGNKILHLFYSNDHTDYRAITFKAASSDCSVCNNMITGLEATQYLCSTSAGCTRFLICNNLSDAGVRGGTAPDHSVISDNISAST